MDLRRLQRLRVTTNVHTEVTFPLPGLGNWNVRFRGHNRVDICNAMSLAFDPQLGNSSAMKVGIIGLGYVGTSVAISTLHSGIATELVLNDIDAARAEGEAMDLAHGAPFYPHARVGVSAIEDMRDADAVVIAAGKGGDAEQTRLELLNDNARIMRAIGRSLSGCKGVVIVVSNPVDVLTHVVADASGLPRSRVIGTGTMLDTARLRQMVGAQLRLDPRSVHANVVGEHGDSEVPLWSCANIGGRPLRQFSWWNDQLEDEISSKVRRAAYEIIQRKGATNHAIGLVTAALMRWILRGERRVLTVSRVHEGAFKLRDVALSLPSIVDAGGVVEVIEPEISVSEYQAVQRSAEVLREAHASITG